MNAQVEAYQEGYIKATEDMQRDIYENMLLQKVEFIYVDYKKRTAEYAAKLREKVVDSE